MMADSSRSVVLHPAVDPPRLDAMRAAAPGLTLHNAASEADALVAMPRAIGFVGRITPPLLAAADELRWVQTNTASLEHVVFPELIAHPCILTNCAGLFGDIIAEHVFGLLLAMSRNLHHYRDRQRERRFEPFADADTRPIDFAAGPSEVSPADRCHHRLQDWSMLIVGVGGIGAAVASRAVAWGIPTAGVDPRRRKVAGVLPTIDTPRRLPEVIGKHDVVVIAAPHTPETEGLFDAELLGRMRPGTRLINVGRGAIVSLDAVTDALRSGQLAAVGLDVFETEPLPSEHPLWDEPNAILTPHVAACSTAIAPRHLRLICGNLGRFDRGEPLRNVVSKSAWH